MDGNAPDRGPRAGATDRALRDYVDDLLDWSTEVDEATDIDETAVAPPAQRGPSQNEHTKPGLSEQQLAILGFEKQWWRYAGAKEQAIRDAFAMSPTRYYQALNSLLDSPDAMAHDPGLVQRLRRLRASRTRLRSRS
jgi:hypothetical protein